MGRRAHRRRQRRRGDAVPVQVAVSDRIGFMQGRLSSVVDGRLQSFPWDTWEREIGEAATLGFALMEWTLDQDRLHANPLLTAAGRPDVAAACRRHRVRIPSLTGDCFMQAPFWKAGGEDGARLRRDFLAVVDACAAMAIAVIVVPLVDNGRLETGAHEEALVSFLQEHTALLARRGVGVAFESDFAPGELARFIARLDPAQFGINYDIGNSAALGFDPREEMAAYGPRIINVHVKDRIRGGTTVPLGRGAADFDVAFGALHDAGYRGHYILQTARASDGDHASVLLRYRAMTAAWLSRYDH
jgi:hexulose-6-phosphate isomerase